MDEYLLNSSQERDRRNTFNDMNGRRQSSLFKDNYSSAVDKQIEAVGSITMKPKELDRLVS